MNILLTSKEIETVITLACSWNAPVTEYAALYQYGVSMHDDAPETPTELNADELAWLYETAS